MEELEDIDGVGSAIASKLKGAGYVTVETVVVSPPTEIMEKTGIGFNTILKIQEAARKMVSAEFKTAQEFYEQGKRVTFQEWLKPPAKFIQNYFFRLGFLDGTAGFVQAILMSFHSFLVRAKLFMLWKN